MNKYYLKLRSAFIVFLSLVMFFNNAMIIIAAEKNTNTVSPCYNTIDSTATLLNIEGIKATCSASMNSSSSASLKIKMELQKKKSSGYTTIETWTTSKNGTNISISEKRNINILCDYRLKVTFTANNESTVRYAYD